MAEPKQKAICGHCGSDVHAKCGSKVVWHWAHVSVDNCDSWYEPETIWHRTWKSHFGISCSEISIVKEGTRHIADVLTNGQLVIEFQNSPISSETIIARESFYQKMIWVINGEGFKDNFQLFDKDYYQNWKLHSEVVPDFHHQSLHKPIKALLVLGSNIKQPAAREVLIKQKFIHLPQEDWYVYDLGDQLNSFAAEARLEGGILKLYREQRTESTRKEIIYNWHRPRVSWLDSKAPVFIDFNDDYLVWVKTNMGGKSGEGVKIPKKEFLAKYVTPPRLL